MEGHATINELAEHVPAFAPGWALYLDVDGTLLELAEHPAAVQTPAGLVQILESLVQHVDTPIALISGRTIADLDRLFAPLCLPCAGQHGAERRDAQGSMQAAAVLDASFDRTRSELAAFAKTRPGLLLDDKGATLGLHYRRSPALAGAVERAVHEAVARLGTAYEVQPGKMVYEIRPRHCDKGRAIAAFAAEAPFAARLPVFIGDDVTDEHGFGIVNRMGGHSIKVGAGATAAQWRLRDTAGVVKWLRRYMCSQGYTDVG